jgi:hypothetical protein
MRIWLKVILAGVFLCAFLTPTAAHSQQTGSTPPAVEKTTTCFCRPLASGGNPVPPAGTMSPGPASYDEQIGSTFTQSFTSIAYNVTAVEQSDPVSDMGPAYVLNGVSDMDYWYQVGLTWNWNPGYYPGTGFDMVYEVWNSTGSSISPTNGSAGLLSFSGPVNAGDQILLNLYFSATYGVVLLVKDFNTGAYANKTYSAEGGSYFAGLNSTTAELNGYFTGLMTEWYHSSPYYSNVSPVIYSDPYLGLSSAWMWADEFGCSDSSCSNRTALFYNSTIAPISYQNPTQLQEFSANGATEFSDAYELITGPAYVSLTISYSVTGGGVGYSPPSFNYSYHGEIKSVVLTRSPTAYTVDADTNWSVTGLLTGSSQEERWTIVPPSTGLASSNQSFVFAYRHQYRLFVTGGSGGSNGDGWYNSGSTATASSYGVFDRNDGSGMRIVSYSIDGLESPVTPTVGTVSVSVTMTSSHQVIFATVEQYRVTLDAGAMAGLKSITPPTVPGDNYWYDAGSGVSVGLNGVWDRSSGTGMRLAAYSLDGGAETAVNTTGPVIVLSLGAISSPHAVASVTVEQYQVTLDGGATAALSSITQPTLNGDNYWYDAGTPVNVTLNGIWGRSSGVGTRLTSLSVDGGPVTRTETTGDIVAVSLKAIGSPQSIAATFTTQYELLTSSGAVVAVTPPSINGDVGWYDAGTPVVVTYQTAWNFEAQSRGFATEYSVNGGSVSPLNESSTGTFQVALTMDSEQSVAVLSTTQYNTTFAFTNALGSEAVVPTELQLTIDAKPSEVTGFSIWLNNGTTFTISKVVYESSDVTPANFTRTVDGPLQLTVRADVYDGTIAVHDFLGFAVAGAQVKMTLANGTTISGTTNGDGLFTAKNIPLGTFTASVSSLGSMASVAGNASQQGIASASVVFGPISLGLVVALAAGAVVAGVVFLRRRKS